MDISRIIDRSYLQGTEIQTCKQLHASRNLGSWLLNHVGDATRRHSCDGNDHGDCPTHADEDGSQLPPTTGDVLETGDDREGGQINLG